MPKVTIITVNGVPVVKPVEQDATERAQNIPGWATWDEDQVLAWIDSNISAPLAAATTLAEAKVVLGKMDTAMQAMARLLVALRDKTWPGLND